MAEEKKSPKEVIESDKTSHHENAYLKFPGGEFFEVPNLERGKYHTSVGRKEVEKIIGKRKSYTSLHTHPRVKYNLGPIQLKGNVAPSFNDMQDFLGDKKMKYMAIAQRDTKTGEVGGVLYMHKGKNFRARDSDLTDKKKFKKAGQIGKLPGLMYVYGLKHKLIPAKGYKLNGSKIRFVKDKEKDLEKRLFSIISLTSLGAGILFLSPNLTGNAIANLTTKTSSFIGAGLFIVGIVGSYFWFKKK